MIANLKEIRINKNNIIIQLFTCILSLVLYIIFINLIEDINDYNFETVSVIFSWIGIFIFIYSVYTWYRISGNIFCPYTIFLTFFMVFNFGQCFMWAIGIHVTDEIGKINPYNVLPALSQVEILKTQLYVCLTIIFFHCGALFCYKPKNNKIIVADNNNGIYYKIMFIISCLIAVIVIPTTIYRAFNFLRVSLNYGYGALYYSDIVAQDGITMILEIFFFPALVGMLVGSKYSNKTTKFVYTIFFIYFALNFLQGDRGTWLYKLIALIWLRHSFYKKINFKIAIKIISIALIILYLVYALLPFRAIGFSNITIQDIINSFSLSNSPIVQGFFEMGSSMTINAILLNVGNEIWNYSNSFLVSILGMPTTKIPIILGLDLVLIDNWFSQDYLGINWGAGFTMIGEVFLNYGLYLTPFILIIIGYFIGSVLYIRNEDNIGNYPLKQFFVCTSLVALTGWSRGTSIMFLRNWFRGTLLIYLVIIIVSKYVINHKKNILYKI